MFETEFAAKSCVQTLSSSIRRALRYFLNVFGLRSIYNLVLGGENAADVASEQAAMVNGMLIIIINHFIK